MSAAAPPYTYTPIKIELEETAFPHTRFADEFQQMALELHCHHSGRSVIWDKENIESWKSCQFHFCQRRYQLFISMTHVPSLAFDPFRVIPDDNPAPSFGDDSDK